MKNCDLLILLFYYSLKYTSIQDIKEKNIRISIINLFWLKPLKIKKYYIDLLKSSKFGGLVLDDEYPDGIAKSISNDLSNISEKKLEH